MKDKVIIITGSSLGIGRSLAEKLGARGAKIILNSRGAEKLEVVKQELLAEGYDVAAVAGDVSKVEDCRKIVDFTIKTYGRIDYLINNAGVNMRGRIEDSKPETLRLAMDINFGGSLYMTRLALPQLKANKGGVLFASSVAAVHGLPMHAVYSASKMALLGLAEGLKIELHDSGVYVGVAYISVTENEPGKTIYDSDGNKVPKETVGFLKVQPIGFVADGIIKMIERRTFKKVFSPIGKLNAIVNRISPSLVDKILTNAYKKQEW